MCTFFRLDTETTEIMLDSYCYRALSHELASSHFDKKGDEYWRDYHLERCQNCYSDWGATAKNRTVDGKLMRVRDVCTIQLVYE